MSYKDVVQQPVVFGKVSSVLRVFIHTRLSLSLHLPLSVSAVLNLSLSLCLSASRILIVVNTVPTSTTLPTWQAAASVDRFAVVHPTN